MSKPTAIGTYRIKGIDYQCYYLEHVKFAVAEKTGYTTGEEVCRVNAESEEQAKEDIEKCLNDTFGEGGVWE